MLGDVKGGGDRPNKRSLGDSHVTEGFVLAREAHRSSEMVNYKKRGTRSAEEFNVQLLPGEDSRAATEFFECFNPCFPDRLYNLLPPLSRPPFAAALPVGSRRNSFEVRL